MTTRPSLLRGERSERLLQQGPHTRIYVSKRSWLDAGTEVLPGDRKFTDYAFPPSRPFGEQQQPPARPPAAQPAVGHGRIRTDAVPAVLIASWSSTTVSFWRSRDDVDGVCAHHSRFGFQTARAKRLELPRPALRGERRRNLVAGRSLRCRRPPTGPASGRPDDRLRRVTQYSRDSAARPRGRGVLDTRMRGYDDGREWREFFKQPMQDTPPRSRGTMRPSFAKRLRHQEIRGRGECRVPNAPAASCALCSWSMHTSIHSGGTGNIRHSPRNGFNGLYVISPGTGLSCPRHP